jgi:UDP-N-acetylmuramoyl-tripeptide--D-alanyl-D-alanine ligase
MELGKNSIKFHKDLKDVIKKSGIDEVYTIGSKMKYLHKNLVNTKLVVKHYTSRKSFVTHLVKMSFSNSVVLVKGSRGLKMEEFVTEIKNKTLS